MMGNGLVKKTATFLEMIKVEHSIFALPFAYLGLILAERGLPNWHLFSWVTLAMVSFRTMAMGLNRLIDRVIDAKNPRTKERALPAGLLTPAFVWCMTAVSFVIFEISAYVLGPLCFRLSAVPVFLAWSYPWMKRFTWFSHLVLGIILGIAPYGAWLASRQFFSWIPGFFMLGVVTWVVGFDIIYALQDIDFDRKSRLYSFPAKFGPEVSLRVTRILHAITVVSWSVAGRLAGCGWIYLAGMLIVTFFLLREHWLIRAFGLKKLNEAFFTMNAIVSLSVFIAAAVDFSFGRIHP